MLPRPKGVGVLTTVNPHHLKIPLSLSWFRVAAALCVFFSHSKLHWFGGQGSIFFMVISGYIFTRLFLKTKTLDKKFAVRNFLKGRLKKIIPPLFLVLIFNLIYKLMFAIPFDYLQILSIFTFTSNYYNAYFSHPDNGLSHLWTISLIVQFYLFWSFCFIQLLKSRDPRKEMSIFLVLIIAAVMIYRSFMELSGIGTYAYLFNAFETRADAMATGALLAVNIDRPVFNSFFQRVPSIFIFIISMAGFYLMGQQTIIFRNTIGFDLHAFFVCLLILSLIGLENKKSSFERASNAAYITFLFYLLHPWALALGNKLPLGETSQVMAGAFLLLSVLSVFVYRRKILTRIIQSYAPQKTVQLSNFVDNP